MPLDKVIKSEFLLFNFSCAQRGIESKGLGDNETESWYTEGESLLQLTHFIMRKMPFQINPNVALTDVEKLC